METLFAKLEAIPQQKPENMRLEAGAEVRDLHGAAGAVAQDGLEDGRVRQVALLRTDEPHRVELPVDASDRVDAGPRADALHGAPAGEAQAPGPVYSAEEVQLRHYGETAVVAFRLVATPPGGIPAAWITKRAGSSPAPVTAASPTAIGPIRSHSALSGP